MTIGELLSLVSQYGDECENYGYHSDGTTQSDAAFEKRQEVYRQIQTALVEAVLLTREEAVVLADALEDDHEAYMLLERLWQRPEELTNVQRSAAEKIMRAAGRRVPEGM